MDRIDFDANTPIYLQIIDKIKLYILSGKWQQGERIPSVRDLSVVFGVNPNTMQRALSELERMGLLYSERTSGRYITKDAAIIETYRNESAQKAMAAFLEQIHALGYTTEQIITLLEGEH